MKIFVFVFILFNLGYWPIRHAARPELRRHIGPAFYLAATSSFLVAFLTPSMILLLLWSAVVACLGVRDRMALVCRYALMMPLMPSIGWYMLAGHYVLGLYAPVDLLGLAGVAMTFFIRRRAQEPPARGFSAEDAALAVLVVLFGLAPLRLADPFDMVRSWLEAGLPLLVPYWLLRRNVRTREELLLVAGCLGVSAALLSVMAVYEHHSGWALFDQVSTRLGNAGANLARTAYVRGGALRAATSMSGPIELGVFLVMGLIGTYSARRFFRVPTVWWGVLGLTVLGLLVTQSRLAVMGSALALLVVLVVQRRALVATLLVAGMAAGYGFLRALAFSSMQVAAFLGAGKQVGVYSDYRTLLLARGLEEGRKHPFFGAPMKDVLQRLADIMQGEHIVDLVNTYLTVFLISGLFGLGALLLSLGFVLVPLLRRPPGSQRSTDDDMARAFTIAVLVSILAQLVGTSFGGRQAVMMALALGFARVMRVSGRRQAGAAMPAPPATGRRGPAVRKPAAAAPA